MTRLTTMGAGASLVVVLAGCASSQYPLDEYEEVQSATVLEAPAPDPAALRRFDAAQVSRGKYLVEMIGCGACHTDGAIVGEPKAARQLAGSRIGIAYTNPLKNKHPGVVYPPNLTPDPATGLGKWSDEQIVAAIRSGKRQLGPGHLIVMSWPLYQRMSDEDVSSVVAYLRSIPPVQHRVPDSVLPGKQAPAPFVHFGVYLSKDLGSKN